jgi:hypothetical protein
MTKTKELSANNPYLNLSLIDFLRFIDPSEKSKYVDLMFRLFFKKRFEPNSNDKSYIETRLKDLGISEEKIKNYDSKSLLLFNQFYETHISQSEYKLVKELCDLHDRKLSNIDVNQIKSFEDLSSAVTLSNIKKYLKDSEKSIKIIHKDEKWLVLKPLSLQSSMKYGGGTKWCTTSSDGYNFYRYSKNGILMYIINLETGNKYGFFHSIHSDPETSFWNTIDNRVDSMQTEIDGYILDIIRNDIKIKITNFEYFSKEETKLYQKTQELTVDGPIPMTPQEPALNTISFTNDQPENVYQYITISGNITPSDGIITTLDTNTTTSTAVMEV